MNDIYIRGLGKLDANPLGGVGENP